MDLLPYLARFALGTVFALAAFGKLFRLKDFEEVVGGFRLLPAAMVRPTARVLPWVELACAACLGIGLALAAVTWLVIGLLALFGLAMGINLVRGQSSECGCGVAGSGEISWWLVGRNVVLIGLAATMLDRSPSGMGGQALTAMMVSTTAVLALSVASAYLTAFRRAGSLHTALRHGGWAP